MLRTTVLPLAACSSGCDSARDMLSCSSACMLAMEPALPIGCKRINAIQNYISVYILALILKP